MIDVLQISNWLFTSAHSKNRVQLPKRMPRPGVVDDEVRIGGKGYSVERMREMLDTFEERAATGEVTTTEVG